MEIDDHRVRRAGHRIRQVGDDARGFLDRMAPALDGGLGNVRGLASVTTLRQVITRLADTVGTFAEESRHLGGNVSTAADNHRDNEKHSAGAFTDLVGATRKIGGR
ncbi:hypothetical protein [Phytomonospora endophytica]|uniref:Uncharacterized protein n=1 Tax=Phytomonospora endophytica TaxID=714109 RepID=A0A841FYM6_9ACTN|nr:hypothetical protein [Phytomonospora endophytica]MBB6039843.1 hypothetical protein [Phytomonospora endophytica]GIG70303.1 hypothetical protein Pen01_65980 [Phytomonospora endophytica]